MYKEIKEFYHEGTKELEEIRLKLFSLKINHVTRSLSHILHRHFYFRDYTRAGNLCFARKGVGFWRLGLIANVVRYCG